MQGKLIAVEGLHGAGKSALAGELVERIAANHPAVLYAEPGATPAGRQIRQLVKDPELHINAHAEALLFAAARAQLAEQVRCDLDTGRWVVLDRWVYSSIALQGEGRGLGMARIQALNAWAAEQVEPDLWIYLRLSPEESRRRCQAGEGDVDHIAEQDLAFFQRASEGYERLAAEDERAVVLNAEMDFERLAERAWREVQHLDR